MEKVVVADFNNPLHAEAIVFLLNEYAKDEMGGGTELSDFARANLIAELQKRPHAYAVIAFVNDEPAGLAVCFEGFSSFYCMPLLNIHDLVVLEKYRGLGISHKLLARVEELAQQNGCCKLTLEVLEGNVIAQKAYRSFGFKGYELVAEMGHAMFWQKKLI